MHFDIAIPTQFDYESRIHSFRVFTGHDPVINLLHIKLFAS